MLSLVLPLLGAGHPLWMDCGRWPRVFFPHPHVGENREDLFVKL